jgi:hypothetical protein
VFFELLSLVEIKRVRMSNLPDFTAYEINELAKRAIRNEYYAKCLKFVKQYLDLSDENTQLMTDKQKGWLWGIKTDLKED